MFSIIIYIVSVACVCSRFPAWGGGVWGDFCVLNTILVYSTFH